jgi:N-terminal half of MaoC dehydratase
MAGAAADASTDPEPEFGDWGAPVRVRIDAVPVALFARAVKDRNPVFASERAAHDAGFEAMPVPPTFTFVMTHGGALPDLQPAGSSGSMAPPDSGLPSDGTSESGLYLHGEQHFEYHRQPVVGDVLEGRMRVSKPFLKQGRRGEMQMTILQTRWSDAETGDPVVTEQIVSVFLPNG